MTSKIDEMKKELDNLIIKGNHLYLSMVDDFHGLPSEFKDDLKKKNLNLPSFKKDYDSWHSESMAIIKQLLPDRFSDFLTLLNSTKTIKEKRLIF